MEQRLSLEAILEGWNYKSITWKNVILFSFVHARLLPMAIFLGRGVGMGLATLV